MEAPLWLMLTLFNWFLGRPAGVSENETIKSKHLCCKQGSNLRGLLHLLNYLKTDALTTRPLQPDD